MINDKFSQYATLMRLDKPIGILLLLWPTLWALCIASNGIISFKLLIIFILGTIITRSAGCIMNDFADRQFDRHVNRTQHRPLTTGQVSVKEALLLAFVLGLIALALVLMLNRLCLLLAIIGVALTVIYPFLKRYTHIPQFVLGFLFTWGIPMAFAAVLNTVPAEGWILWLIAAIWPVVYDTMYAMSDRDDDIMIGVKSTAILFGRADKLLIGILQFSLISMLSWYGTFVNMHSSYYFGLAAATMLSIYQQYLIKDRDRQLCFRAFLNNQWIGLIVFIGIVFSMATH